MLAAFVCSTLLRRWVGAKLTCHQALYIAQAAEMGSMTSFAGYFVHQWNLRLIDLPTVLRVRLLRSTPQYSDRSDMT
jgi:hypothetical protein